MASQVDVIIIGGRPAGSTLAARLGKMGLRVLILERAEFPALPAVSCPLINAATMEMLDEIGADEAAYARGTPKIRRIVQALAGGVTLPFEMPAYKGRDYAYAIDRARFDAALWETAIRYPTVEGRTGFNVTDLIVEDDGRVLGVIGHGADKQVQRLTASVTVGADGRFSLVARRMQAEERLKHDDFPTSILYAYWQGVRRMGQDEPTAMAYAGEEGVAYLVMDSADGTTAVAVEGRADRFDASGTTSEALYLDFVRQHPELASRLENAEQVTTVRGMKKIGNLYRQPGGAGWALVGDALVQQDPLDGQGIYNAVYTAKALAWAIRDWMQGERSWTEALAWYDETVQIRTVSVYQALLDRTHSSFYAQAPEWLAGTLARWTMDDPMLKTVMGRFITRQIPGEALRLMMPGLIAGAAVRGGLRDLGQRLLSRR
jgi:flavin-dependent dehydrogenase